MDLWKKLYSKFKVHSLIEVLKLVCLSFHTHIHSQAHTMYSKRLYCQQSRSLAVCGYKQIQVSKTRINICFTLYLHPGKKVKVIREL